MKAYFARELFDGQQLISKGMLLTDQGQVVWAGPASEFPASDLHMPDSREDVVFLMPGLIDCHMHLASLEETPATPADWAKSSAQALANLEQLASAGVVACRDLGSNGGFCLGLAQAQREGLLKNLPLLLSAGRALCATGGHGYQIGLEGDGVAELLKACRQVIKDGADVVKVMMSGGVNSPGEEPGPPELLQEEIDIIVKEAHARGRKVAVHAHGNTAIRRSVLAGVDSVEHGVFNSVDILQLMKKQGCVLVPTLSAPYYASREGLVREPNNPDHKRSQKVMADHNAITLEAQKAGVSLCMGTDAGSPFNPFDQACFELVLLNRIGIDPLDVLRIATANGAALLGISDKLGSLKPGMEASFLTLEKSPMAGMDAICGAKHVYIKGEKVI